jgi:hypothetical protein
MATTKKTETLQEKLNHIQTTLNAPKNLYNSFGKYSYRNLEGILAGVKPLLKETGCVFTLSDDIIEVGGRVYVKACASISFEGESISVNDEDDKFGNNVSLWQSQSKEERESKTNRNFLGNGKSLWSGENKPQGKVSTSKKKEEVYDDLPF